MIVGGVSRAATGTRPVRRRQQPGAFPVEAEHAGQPEAAVGATGIGMASLLAVQEAESGVRQDQEARRHGEAVIGELAGLQRALLCGNGPAPELEALAKLAGRSVRAADPALAGLLRAIQLRAGIELARRGRAASM